MNITHEAKSVGKFAKKTGGVHAYRKAVFIIEYRKEKSKILYLILKRKLHWKGWEFPKGGVERKEDLRKTVIRELYEETKLKPIKITNHKLCGRFIYDKATQRERNFYGQTFQLFSVQVSSSKVKYDKLEHQGYSWLEFPAALKLLTWKNQKKCLRIVNNSLMN